MKKKKNLLGQRVNSQQSTIRIICLYRRWHISHNIEHVIDIPPIYENGKIIGDFQMRFESNSELRKCLKKYCNLGKAEYVHKELMNSKWYEYVSFSTEEIKMMFYMIQVSEPELNHLRKSHHSFDAFSTNLEIVVIATEMKRR